MLKRRSSQKKEPLATSQNYPMILSKLATARGFNGETCRPSLGQLLDLEKALDLLEVSLICTQ